MNGTDSSSSIQVAVRVRPFTIREAAQLTKLDESPLFLGDGSLAAAPVQRTGQKGLRSVIKVVDEKCLVFDPPEDAPVQRFSRSFIPTGKRVKDQTFGFDRVFDDNATQGDVYEATTRNLLDSVLDGYNATVFAYGATGCGKTHTITGTAQQPGIIFMTMQELFEKVEELKESKITEVTLSYLEIYNETIRDLLNATGNTKQGLMLREDSHQAVSVAGLSSHKPQNVQEVMDMVIQGNAMRTQSPTEANATSSRSHAVLQVNVSLKDRDASVNEPVTMATLSIIDLAGSERASATKNRGERLLEGANINKSLLALGSCINALCDPRKKNHVPYRNSKLTRLLKFSLGGNCRTVMIVCVSPSSQHFDETQNTLRYANRAKNIQTKSVRNVFNVDRHVKDYLKKIDEQMARINELTAQQKQAEEFAFVKFRKVEARRTEVFQEGIRRIRTAYDHTADARKERIADLKRLRQVEKRICTISGWVGSFDQICDTREGEEASAALVALRKTAQGILIELESSRQHFHQRLAKNNWARAIDTAFQDALRQLQGVEGYVIGSIEEGSLQKELDFSKTRADLEAQLLVLEQEKLGEAGLMHIVLSAHFETIAILNQILQMTEEEAVQAARSVLGKLLQSCTEAAAQVIKPDGSLQILEAVPPTRSGTPRKRRPIALAEPSPMKTKLEVASGGLSLAIPPHVLVESDTSSPTRSGSPRRRVKFGGAKRGVAFGSSPKKATPMKKRAVRWRDDAEDGGSLVEFQATPQPISSSPPEPEDSTASMDLPNLDNLSLSAGEDVDDSSASIVTTAPVEARRPGTGRFAAGFLSKKSDGSPVPTAPTLTFAPFSSDEDGSPLRELSITAIANRANSTMIPRRASPRQSKENQGVESALLNSDPSADLAVSADRETAEMIKGLIGRNSLSSKRESAHRRRSPTSSNTSSPPQDASGIFSASHARRMVRSSVDRDDSLRTVLAPRSTPVTKGVGPVPVRRSLMDGSGAPSASGAEHGRREGHIRMSSLGGRTTSVRNSWR